MITIQRKWILNQVANIISIYNEKDKLTESDYEDLVNDLGWITEKTKNNKECVQLMISIAALFADKEQEIEG